MGVRRRAGVVVVQGGGGDEVLARRVSAVFSPAPGVGALRAPAMMVSHHLDN